MNSRWGLTPREPRLFVDRCDRVLRCRKVRHEVTTHCTCTVEVSPDEVDAGTDITLKVQRRAFRQGKLARAAGFDPRWRRRRAGASRTHRGRGTTARTRRTTSSCRRREARASTSIAPSCSRRTRTAPCRSWLRPRSPFVVKAHEAALNAWDVPSAVVAGERFKFMVGVRCSAGCCLAGHGLAIFDQRRRASRCRQARQRYLAGDRCALCCRGRSRSPVGGTGPINGRSGPPHGIAELPHAAGVGRRVASRSSPLPIARSRSRLSTGKSKRRSRTRAWSCTRTAR